MFKSFYKSISLRGKESIKAELCASRQEGQIAYWFRNHSDLVEGHIPWEVAKEVDIHIVSTRRAITNLTKAGVLKKLDDMEVGDMGQVNHKWVYNTDLIKKS